MCLTTNHESHDKLKKKKYLVYSVHLEKLHPCKQRSKPISEVKLTSDEPSLECLYLLLVCRCVLFCTVIDPI